MNVPEGLGGLQFEYCTFQHIAHAAVAHITKAAPINLILFMFVDVFI